MIFSLDGSVFRREGTPYLNTKVMTDAPLDMEMRKRYLGMFWGSYCSLLTSRSGNVGHSVVSDSGKQELHRGK